MLGLADLLGLVERALRGARDPDPQIRAGCRARAILHLQELRRQLVLQRPDRYTASLWCVHLDVLERAFVQSQWRTVWAELGRLYRLSLADLQAAEVENLIPLESTN